MPVKVYSNNCLISKHDVLLQLQQRGFTVEPVHNHETGRFDDSFLSVNDMLCYLLPIDNTPQILSDRILTNTDFVIASLKTGSWTHYYVIPSDLVVDNRGSYPLPYSDYLDRWDLLKL